VELRPAGRHGTPDEDVMLDRLLPYYEKELTFLKKEASLFARKYPHIAGRLSLQESDTEHMDPHAERLIQAVALLTARIRAKLDDKIPELSEALIDILLPHYLAEVPSFTTIQFDVDPLGTPFTACHAVSRGTPLLSARVGAEPCRYQTCFDVEVWPLRVEACSIDFPARPLPRRGPTTGIASALRLKLTPLFEASVSGLGMERLRFHLTGEPAVAYGLYEMLLNRAVHVEIVGKSRKGGTIVLPLRPSALRPSGFGERESLLPLPPNSFAGFMLLSELFTFPDKFLYFDLSGLEALAGSGIEGGMEVHVFCSDPPPFLQEVSATNFRLGCSPAVNLFERFAEPINVDHRRSEYEVVADARRPGSTRVWRVLDARVQPAARGASAQGVAEAAPERFVPLYSFHPGLGPEHGAMTWQAMRKVGVDGRDSVWLSLGYPGTLERQPEPETVSIRILCTNGDLPRSLRLGGGAEDDFFQDGMPGFLRIRGLRQPSAPLPASRLSDGQWRLVAHLALNQSAIFDCGAESLRRLLQLYEPTGTAAARRQITAIETLSARPSDRLVNGSVLRGVEIEVVLDGTAFAGTGFYLFAAIIDRFLGMYAPINAFTRLQVRDSHDPERVISFLPRAGSQVAA